MRRHAHAFTLVELILVMMLLATVMAVAVPLLGRSLRDRHLQHEALRLLGMAEYARSLAISEGVPMLFWVQADAGRFGTEPKAGFEADGAATRAYTLGEDVWFDAVDQARGVSSSETNVEFGPDGVPETGSVESLRLADKFGGAITVARTEDGYGYEILPGGQAMKRAAFTLVEVLAAMAFMAVLVPVLLGALNVANRAAVAAERSTQAMHLAENKLNELLLDDAWASGSNRGEFEEWPGYRWELESTDWPDATAMTELTMVVTYQVQGEEHSVELSTLAAIAAQ